MGVRGWLGMGVRGGHEGSTGAVLGDGGRRVGPTCQAEGGTADDAGGDDRKSDPAGEAVVAAFKFFDLLV